MFTSAIILAAGRGSRLLKDEFFLSHKLKPLVPIFDEPLIFRNIRLLIQHGIRHLIVVTGFEHHLLEEAIHKETRWSQKILMVHNTEWEKSNGISLLAAESYVKEPFLLMMSDHFFQDALVHKAINHPIPASGVFLCVDYNMNHILDMEDATKVKTEDNNTIRSIGKQLQSYNAIDTGLFGCQMDVFDAMKKAKVNQDCSISHGMQYLANQGKLFALDIQNLFWSDIDTAEDYQFVRQQLNDKHIQ